MKILFALLVSLFPFVAVAQAPAAAATQREAMNKLEWMVGHWKGTGWIEMVPQARHKFVQTEAIQSKLDGLVLIVDWAGARKTARPCIRPLLWCPMTSVPGHSVARLHGGRAPDRRGGAGGG
jgi:hypothetical protein